jgi:AraC family transcriptional regulator, regulatory protein of adaptative response / methylphosphotriester-DNA alkyltransferase methyltransferase
MKGELTVTSALNKVSGRPKEIADRYLIELEKHIDDLRAGRAERTFEVQDFAEKLHVHPTHLSNTLHQVLGQSPCDLYESRLLALAKDLLNSTNKTIAQIAHQLYYDPSNFTKFFKNYMGITPKEFRKQSVV